MQSKVNQEQEKLFKDLPVPKALIKMILPAVASQLIVLIYNMADTFFVGQTNNPYMVAGTSLILPVFNISLCLAGLAGIGGGSLISRLLGQERVEEAGKVSAFSLYLAFCIAALFALVMGLFMEPILLLLGAGDNTYEYAKQYATCVIVVGGAVQRAVQPHPQYWPFQGGQHGDNPGRASEYSPGPSVHVRADA